MTTLNATLIELGVYEEQEQPCERCGSRYVIDHPIHGGHSRRRDCAACGRTHGFPVWNPAAWRQQQQGSR